MDMLVDSTLLLAMVAFFACLAFSYFFAILPAFSKYQLICEGTGDRNVWGRVAGAEKLLFLVVIAFFCFFLWTHHWSLIQGCGAGLIVGAVIGTWILDRAFFVIPDRFHVFGFVGTLLSQLNSPTPAAVLVNALTSLFLCLGLYLFGRLYERLRARSPMGLGDVKLLAWLGIATSAEQMTIGLLVGCLGAGFWFLTKKLFFPKASTESVDSSHLSPFAFAPWLLSGIGLCALVACFWNSLSGI